MGNMDYYDRGREGREDRSRLFESLEEPEFDTRSSFGRNNYGTSGRRAEDIHPRDEYRRPVQREPQPRPSYEDYAGNGNVTIYAPKSYSDVQAMIENLARKEAVIVNLESVETESAQRILDFLSGAAFALGGSMRRIKAYTFLITPQGTGITDTNDYYNR